MYKFRPAKIVAILFSAECNFLQGIPVDFYRTHLPDIRLVSYNDYVRSIS